MSEEMLTTVAAWLLTYAAHSTLLLTGAFLLQRWLVRSAAARELLWKLAAFAALGTATVHSIVLANSQKLQPFAGRWEVTTFSGSKTAVASEPALSREIVQSNLASAQMPVVSAPQSDLRTPERPNARTPERGNAQPVFQTIRTAGHNWPAIVISTWLLGALVSIGRLIRRYQRARGRFASRVPVNDRVLLAELEQLRNAMQMSRTVRLSLSDAILSPVALGKWEICLPSGLLPGLSAAQRQSMLAHELGHLERRDPQWLLAFGSMEALCFFQPLTQLARRQFQVCAEQLCDQLALAHTREPLALAQCLAEVARWLRGERDLLPYPGMAESASPLLARVERVLSGQREPVVVRRSVRWLAAGTLTLFALVAPGVTSVTRASTAPLDPLLQSPDIAAAVQATVNGSVRFAFPTRASVCGTGEEKDGTRMFALKPTAEWQPAGAADRMALYVWDRGKLMRNDLGTDGRWTTPCNNGLTRVDLRVRAGKVDGLDLSVADPAPRFSGRDLGAVDAQLAVDYLLSLSRTHDEELAHRALLAAILAEGAISPTELRSVQNDARVPARVQLAASNWADTFLSDRPQQAGRPEFNRIADLTLPMTDRLTALASATRSGMSARELIAFYPRVRDRAMRVELIDWLAQREDDAVRNHLRAVVRDAAVLEEQQAALRVLAASRNADARAFAESYLRKQPVKDETVNARVYNDWNTGAPQSAIGQRIANAPDGIVHVAYPARPEACGSGVDFDGAGMFALMPTDTWQPANSAGMAAFYSFDRDDFSRLALSPNSSWTSKCQNGPVHLLLQVRDGRVVNLRIAVGNPVREPRIDTELGQVPGPEATNFLIELASSSGETIASNAILAAVMAGGEPLLYPSLIRIASDLSRPERVRETALHWAALDPTPGAREAIRRNAASLPRADRKETWGIHIRGQARIADPNDFTEEVVLRIALDPRQPLETRKKAIQWAEDKGASSNTLTSLYDHFNERELKLFLIEFLAACDNEPTSRKLIQIIEQDADAGLRSAARVSLRQHQNAVARAYR